MTHITITIYSETICPWCYIGKSRLDRAILRFVSSHPGTTFEINWKPFYLNSGLDRFASFDKKHYHKILLGGGIDSPTPSPALELNTSQRDPVQSPPHQDYFRREAHREPHYPRTSNIHTPSTSLPSSPGSTASVSASHGSPNRTMPVYQGTERYHKSRALTLEAANELGLEMNLYGRTGWTRDSHKLILLAGMATQRRPEADRKRPVSGELHDGDRGVRIREGRGLSGDDAWERNRGAVSSSGKISPSVPAPPPPPLFTTSGSPFSSPSSHSGKSSDSVSKVLPDDEPTPSPPETRPPMQPRTSSDVSSGSTRSVNEYIVNPLQHILVERLFSQHFSAGADLSCRAFLLSLAKSLGLLSAVPHIPAAAATEDDDDVAYSPRSHPPSPPRHPYSHGYGYGHGHGHGRNHSRSHGSQHGPGYDAPVRREKSGVRVNSRAAPGLSGVGAASDFTTPCSTNASTMAVTTSGSLKAVGAAGGMSDQVRYSVQEKAFLDWLDSPETTALVDKMESESRERGIRGIPTFEIQGRYRVGGAQTEDVFLSVFERVRLAG